MKFRLIIIINILFSLSCTTNREKQQWLNIKHTKNIAELIEGGYNLRNSTLYFDSVCQLLNSVIIYDTSYFRLFITDSIDSIHEKILSKYDLVYYSKETPEFIDINIFSACIKADTLIVYGEQTDTSQIKNLAKEYYYQSENKKIPVRQRKDSIAYFGEIEVPEIIVHFFTNIKTGNGLEISEWTIFFHCLDEIFQMYNETRDELANKKFSKTFDSLSFTQKVAIVKYRPKIVVINLNMDCFIIPPPPPINANNQDFE